MAASTPKLRAPERDGPLAPSAASRADEMFDAAVDIYEQAAERGTANAKRDEQLVEGMRLLEKVFELDFEHVKAKQYIEHGRSLVNVTCMRPRGGEHADAADTGHYITNDELLAMDLEPGRLCENGACCDACSRVQLPSIATEAECNEMISRAIILFPPESPETEGEPQPKGYSWWIKHNLQLQFTAAAGDLKLHLLYIRLLERMRRTMAYEYGIPLVKLSLQQSFIKRLTPKHGQAAGPTHVDECGTKPYHYTSILYLNERPEYQGGDFIYTDPPLSEGGARVETRISPQRGQALVMTGGWENPHYVEAIFEGTRYAVPTFWNTLEPDASRYDGIGQPWTDGDGVGRARAFFESGILPCSAHEFLNFQQYWGRLLS